MGVKTEPENKKNLVDHKIDSSERHKWNLEIDAIYCADKLKAKTLAGEVLSKLFYGIGNAGGFRISGSIEKPKYIVIYTSGDDIYWRDEVDNALGVLLYYGDNRTPGKELHDTKKGGNKILRYIFNLAASDNVKDRKDIPPVFVFQKYNGSRDMKFIGLAVPGIKGKAKKDWLTAVWGCNKSEERFLNYKAFFTILDTSRGYSDQLGSNISLTWLNDIDNGKAYDSKFAPIAWRNYIDKLVYQPLMCKMEKFIKSKGEQLPSDAEELKMLQCIHDYFIDKDGGYSFEPFANNVVMGLDDCVVDIETTRPYKDGGYDGIGQYQLFKSSENKVLVDFFIQAKCYAVDSGLGVHDTSRVISRIKDRQFGIIVTTSYIGEAAFKEILEDGHPIVMITGKTIIDYFKKELEIFDSAKLLGWLKKKYN
jgi:hypothetical protein